MIGGVALNQASGNLTEYEFAMNGTINGKNMDESEALAEGVLRYDDCNYTKRADLGLNQCEFGSGNDKQMMALISYTGYLIFAGCFAATLSSAIASLVGAPRVLQALAKDKLYPLIHVFEKGYGANQDPFRGYFLVFCISLGCILIGKLDLVATLLSNFFVAAYALINFSVFHASITKSPGWRPAFKYYNSWVSLIGAILCVAVMFLMDPWTALATFAIVCILYLYINYRKPEANWGSSTQAQQFVWSLRSVQTLNDIPEHVKNYRPKILVLSGIPAHRQPLVDFANLLTKKLSLLICAHVEKNSQFQYLELLKTNVQSWLKDHNVKAFFSVVPNKSYEDGAISIMNASGLGKLVPNMVLMGFKNNWMEDLDSINEYLNVVHHGFDMHMAVGIMRLKDGCDYSAVISPEDQIIIPAENTKEDLEIDEVDTTTAADKSLPDDENDLTSGAGDDSVMEKIVEDSILMAGNQGNNGEENPMKTKLVENVSQFQAKKRKGNIDVWWLYDDGGLTLLLPYILTTRAQFSDCNLRVFALANKRDELDRETRNMASLLAKFRIDYSDVIVVPDVTKKAGEAIQEEFKIISDKVVIDEAELLAHKEKSNRNLRLAELLREHSTNSEMVIM